MKARAALLLAASAFLAAGCSAGKITAPRYVLSYGISNYLPAPYEPDTIDSGDLHYPADDAQAMRTLLVGEGYAALQASPADCINSAVTKAQIRADIAGLSSLEDDAIIVIFYSSHGTYDMSSDTAYLVPYDAVDATGQIGPSTVANLISPAELSSWIAQTGKRNVIVIINTCYAGGFVDAGAAIDAAPQNYGPYDGGTAPLSGVLSALGSFGELLSKNSREAGSAGPIVISAAGTRESTYEYTGPDFEGHGIFPYYILKAATEGDANGDGFVTATEAYEYAVSGVKMGWNRWALYYFAPEADPNQGGILVYLDFMPRISGGARDLVLFSN